MSNPYDPHHAPTSFPGNQPTPPPQTPPYGQQPPPQPYPPQQQPYAQQPYPPQPPFGGPGGYGQPGFGGPPPKKSAAPLIIGAVVLAVVLIAGAVGGFFLLTGDDDEPRKASSGTSETDEPTEEATEDPTEEPSSEEPVDEPSSPAAPVPPTSDDLTAITGFYTGSYSCNQGETPLTLTIAPNSGNDGLDAVFSFGGSGSDVPSGSYLMEGNLQDGVLALTATDWIVQPPDYVTVDLQANVADPSTDTISGDVLGAGCDTFGVSR